MIGALLALTLASGCFECHAPAPELGAGHARCESCHLGGLPGLDPHAGLVRIPGNFKDMERTCGAAGCHPEMPPRVRASIMSTMAGVVAVDRAVIGPGADDHLRTLCLSCHLGAEKTAAGPVTDASRGGGCGACHTQYVPGAGHAVLRRTPTDEHCFGCHSRSGRISLQAAGWREAQSGETAARVLSDGRGLVPMPGDLHTARGFLCVDCHTAAEVMGEARLVARREDQQRVRCADCHGVAPRTQVLKGLGAVVVAGPPAAACDRDGPHATLGCGTCHDAWAPQCLGCHTAYDPAGTHVDLLTGDEAPGDWIETAGPPAPVVTAHGGLESALFDRPALGVRTSSGARRVETFVPGMILTIAHQAGKPPRFRRLFAPLSAHTTQRAARRCVECHLAPAALGWGRGRLSVARGRWSFAPARPLRPEDGLPDDAWLAFGAERGPESTTRTDARPFDRTEQGRILRVGACLRCHPPGPLYDDFARSLASRARRCVVPPWPP